MRVEVEWTNPAFAKLDPLPERLAFEILRRVDLLASFPEMGVSLHSRYPELANCRQLILSSSYRVIYDFNPAQGTVYILEVQHCRRRLPSASELRHRIKDNE